jgi:hypothetical protein
MRQQASYLNFNFFTVWRIDEGVDYPRFRDLGAHAAPAAVALDDLEGAGTAEAPYRITTADELHAMRLDRAAHYQLANDIDLSASAAWDAGRGWQPVGLSTAGQRFTGTLDGAGFTIRKLTINRPSTAYQGLFGYLSGATVRNLRLESANVRGSTYSGALAGFAHASLVENVQATGDVTGGDVTGGLIGQQSGGSLNFVSFSGSVQGGNSTGGLVGHTTDGAAIRYAFTLGSVTGASYVGGLVGNHSSSGSYPEIADSYSRASVSGSGSIGGLIGYMLYSRVYRSYSSGAVSGTSSVGGFLGTATTATTVSACYWDTGTSGQSTSAGGGGRTTAQMKQQATFLTWNFTTVWNIEENLSYPFQRETAPEIALSPADRYHHNGASSGNVVAVTSNVAWTAQAGDDWITVTAGATGRDHGLITYSVEANPLPAARSGTITVSDATGTTRTFTVRQSADLSLAPTWAHHDAPASTGHVIAVFGNLEWTATPGAPWIVVTDGATGAGTGTVTYRVAENLSLGPRSATIAISGGGIDLVFTVTQSGAAPYLAIAPEWREFRAAGATTQTISIAANSAWTATTGDPWITITGGSSGTGNGVLTYNVAAAQSQASRMGSITLTNGTQTTSHRVGQTGETTVEIDVRPAQPEHGSATGAGWYHNGQVVTVVARPAAGREFLYWTEAGEPVAWEAVFTFTATADRDLMAHFHPAFDPGELSPSELEFTRGGDVLWFLQEEVVRPGQSVAARSGYGGDDSVSWIETTVTGPGTLSYWHKVSSEAGSDFLITRLNTETIGQLSGEVDWERVEIKIPDGIHTIRWEYAKDDGGRDGMDAAFLSEIIFDPTGPGGFENWPVLDELPADRRGPLDRNGPLDLPNILAYAMGLNPLHAIPGDMPHIASVTPTEGHATFRYRRSKNAPEIKLAPQVSNNLVDWQAPEIIDTMIIQDEDDWERVEIRCVAMPGGRMLFRLRVDAD